MDEEYEVLAGRMRYAINVMNLTASERDSLDAFIHGKELMPLSELSFRNLLTELTQIVNAPVPDLVRAAALRSNELELVHTAVGHTHTNRRKLDIQTTIAILSLIVAILAYLNDVQGNSISKQDAQELVEQAIKAVETEQLPPHADPGRSAEH